MPDAFTAPVLLKVEVNISTDEIMPAGAKVLPYRSNIPGISQFVYYLKDESFSERAKKAKESSGGHVIVAGKNYAQGSIGGIRHCSRYLVRYCLAKSDARIGSPSLVDFAICLWNLPKRRITMISIRVMNYLLPACNRTWKTTIPSLFITRQKIKTIRLLTV